ncbi:MAG: YidC/Oxa1 family membrane protein insertase [Candidatus Nomurabacteria bacterium]|jgi:YidC/Oxa1 family membrane protein insertase|nr:YidC/Oxa1 family membrane protein insertase [Candidatus Nomurabacteria bacterium]
MGFFDTVIVQPIFNLLLAIYGLIGDFGIAIIIFTIIVKMALWPLAKKQLHQAKLMRKLQPELAKIKKNAKGNRQVEGMQMMELYKKHNVKPFRSILVLIIQLPIFIALYRVILMIMQNTDAVEKYAYELTKNIGRVQELVQHPDQFHPSLFGVVDLSQTATGAISFSSICILIMILAAVVIQYFLAKQQMPSGKNRKTFRQIMKDAASGKEADQGEINTAVSGQMSKFLPIMMFFILIGFFGALALYYLVTNIMTAIQQTMIFKKDESEMEDLVDGKPSKDISKIQEGEVIAEPKEKQKYNITRISASDKKRRKR